MIPDLSRISQKLPGVLITVTCEDDDTDYRGSSGEFKRHYFKNGDVQTVNGMISYPGYLGETQKLIDDYVKNDEEQLLQLQLTILKCHKN